MDELEKLQRLVGPEAKDWTTARMEQVRHDLDAVAALLLDLNHLQKEHRSEGACGSVEFGPSFRWLPVLV